MGAHDYRRPSAIVFSTLKQRPVYLPGAIILAYVQRFLLSV
jgi:hypothetical protein